MENGLIKAIMFDKDGTLLEFDPFWIAVSKAAVFQTLNELKVSQEYSEDCLRAIGLDGEVIDKDGVLCKGTYEQIAEQIYLVLKNNGVDVCLKTVTQASIDAFHKNVDKGVTLPTFTNLKQTLLTLKEMGVKLVVVTSDDLYTTQICLKGLNILEVFDKICVDDGVHPHKPDPYFANEVCSDYRLSKNQLLMVGDTLTDVAFAKNSGVACVGIAKTDKDKALLCGKADYVIDDFSDLVKIVKGQI